MEDTCSYSYLTMSDQVEANATSEIASGVAMAVLRARLSFTHSTLATCSPNTNPALCGRRKKVPGVYCMHMHTISWEEC